ncbi:MAG: HEAT repeat domain-containing protein, partial [Verrucomicrobiota bacterium]
MTLNPPPEKPGIRAGFFWLMLLVIAAVLAVAAVISFSGNKKPAQSNPAGVPEPVVPAAREQIPITVTAPSLPVSTAKPSPSEPATDKLIAILSDDSLPLKARCEAARALARLGTNDAMTALKNALEANSPPYLKAAIAEAFGECPNAEAAGLLNNLVHSKDEIMARGAVRGLAARGDATSVNSLGNLLFNSETPVSLRTEAALALGEVNQPAAQALLVRAMTEIQDE